MITWISYKILGKIVDLKMFQFFKSQHEKIKTKNKTKRDSNCGRQYLAY